MKKNDVVRVERGWAGHFICSDRCLFRRNTLLTFKNLKIVVSTVGAMRDMQESKFETIGFDRHFETMVFHAKQDDKRYHDMDVHREITLDCKWAIAEIDADDKANEMHETAVGEITRKMQNGAIKND